MSVQDNFTVDAGGTLTREFIYKTDEGTVIDISGYTASAQVRKSTFTELVINSSPEIDPETFVITMQWTPDQTRNLRDSNYIYGLQISNESTGDVIVLTRGIVSVNQAIVR